MKVGDKFIKTVRSSCSKSLVVVTIKKVNTSTYSLSDGKLICKESFKLREKSVSFNTTYASYVPYVEEEWLQLKSRMDE